MSEYRTGSPRETRVACLCCAVEDRYGQDVAHVSASAVGSTPQLANGSDGAAPPRNR